MATGYAIEAEVQLDAAHRVPFHASKCKNLHGHRYRVVASVGSVQLGEGAEQGMVLDFGTVKRLMTQFIHDNCDHAIILWNQDYKMLKLASSGMKEDEKLKWEHDFTMAVEHTPWKCWRGETAFGMTYIMDAVPTAENLAKHWYDMLSFRIDDWSKGRVRLLHLDVYETPTFMCRYPISIT
jgi:6-pyruvoyltetrahydropterin/6-carboxytetrahydropterin synthase